MYPTSFSWKALNDPCTLDSAFVPMVAPTSGTAPTKLDTGGGALVLLVLGLALALWLFLLFVWAFAPLSLVSVLVPAGASAGVTASVDILL
jgi:hypothetical protein